MNFPADFELPLELIARDQQGLVDGRALLAMYPSPRPFPPCPQPWDPLPSAPSAPEMPPELEGSLCEIGLTREAALAWYLSRLPPSPPNSLPRPQSLPPRSQPLPASAAPPSAQQPLPAPPPPAVQGSAAAVNGNPLWAWLAQEVPNATGTYYSYSAKPGGMNRAMNNSGPGIIVFTPHMVNQACEQKAEVTLSHQGSRLNGMVTAIGARPGVVVPAGLTSNRLKARWIISQERSFRALGVGTAAPPGFASGPVMPTSYFAGRVSGGVLVFGASTAAVVENGPP